jgi:DNA-binding MarR family transcriptional regulator
LFLGSRLKRLAEQMQGDVVAVTQGAGVPIQPGQHPLLATLDAYGSKSIGELARAMKMSQPAITKNAAKLADAGLVVIDRTQADGRQRTVSLTSEGQDAIDLAKRTVWPLVAAAVDEVLGGLNGPFIGQIAAIECRLAERSLAERAQAMATEETTDRGASPRGSDAARQARSDTEVRRGKGRRARCPS